MFKTIIIAGLLISTAVFAAPLPNGGKARLRQVLSCEGVMVASLSETHQALFTRLQNLFNTYDLVSSTTPDFVQANMGISIPAFHTKLNSLAQQILEKRQPRDAGELDAILSQLENQVSNALQPPAAAVPRFSSAGKAKMETRGFDEDWNRLGPYMPSGPPDFNRAEQPQPPPPAVNPTDFGFGRPYWPPREKP